MLSIMQRIQMKMITCNLNDTSLFVIRFMKVIFDTEVLYNWPCSRIRILHMSKFLFGGNTDSRLSAAERGVKRRGIIIVTLKP